ncbi:MAG: MATE family efflux transporter [Lachnospiraceae bacterium]|jgi:putative MATE family efflux protein
MAELQKEERKNYLFTDEYLKKLIWPLVLEQLLSVTVGMADTMMVSNVGEAAVSGVSLVDMINNLIFAVFSALATGGAVVATHYLGAGKQEDACRSANQLLLTVAASSVIITALSMVFCRQVLRLLFGKIDDDVMENAMIYFMISALSFPSLAIYNADAALFRSMGNSKITLVVAAIVNVVNVTGNAICVFGLHMGTAGVAVPSLISRTLGAVILHILLLNRNLEVHYVKGYRPDFPLIRRILYIGVPNGIENGIFQLGRVLVVSIISGFGTAQIAANGVANSLDTCGCLIGSAISLAMITVIGQCVGAQDEEQIRYYTKKLLVIDYIASAIVIAGILIFLKPILKIYGLSPEAERLSWILVMIHNGVAAFLWPLAFVLPNMLRACNDVKFTMIVSIASMFIFRVGFSYVIGVNMGMGVIGVWIAMVIDWICRITFFVGRYLRGTWKKTMRRM